MKRMHFELMINAPVSKVWDTMLADATYREWTKAFHPGSFYRGDWSEGSQILFLGPGEDGKGESGMVSRIKENRKHEFISIEHLGMIENGVIDTSSEQVKKWTPAYEDYSFAEKDGQTKLSIDCDTSEEHADMFEKMWPSALQTLKQLCEKS